MSGSSASASSGPWWKEPTKDQWYAYFAAWLGWTLDAFDFTIFLLIMLPISQEFGVPLTAVTAVFAVTLWMRLVGATVAGWMADRMGRKAPLMISIIFMRMKRFFIGIVVGEACATVLWKLVAAYFSNINGYNMLPN